MPTHLPLDAEMREQEAEAQSKIEQAKLIGGQRVTGHVERVRPGQAGYSIAEEAKLINAAAVVVGLRYRNGAPLYDKTLQTVLGERPCRVIVVSETGTRAGAGPSSGARLESPSATPVGLDRPPSGINRGSVRALLRSSSSPLGLVDPDQSPSPNGGGPLSVGVLLGVAFLAVGAARLWVCPADAPVSTPEAAAAAPAPGAAAAPRRRRPRPLRRRLLGRSASRSTSPSASSPTAASG